jgi:hypothetical protein
VGLIQVVILIAGYKSIEYFFSEPPFIVYQRYKIGRQLLSFPDKQYIACVAKIKKS